MRHDKYYRCVANIERVPEIKDFITSAAMLTNSDVVYCDEAAETDDLDYVDKVKAHLESYNPEMFRYHCGSLWARRGQDLLLFWHYLYQVYGESFAARVPVVFTRETIGDESYNEF
jgi:hypothetical protein